jgi:hypothetical protein
VPDVGTVPGPRDDRAVAVELGPVVSEAPEPAPPVVEDVIEEPSVEPPADDAGEVAAASDATADATADATEVTDESEPDAEEVRRRIAVASRSFDPDHQIRRAMDAFFSPAPAASEREQPREH